MGSGKEPDAKACVPVPGADPAYEAGMGIKEVILTGPINAALLSGDSGNTCSRSTSCRRPDSMFNDKEDRYGLII